MTTEALTKEVKIRISRDIKTNLEKLAAVRHTKPAAEARQAIREYIAKHAKVLKQAA